MHILREKKLGPDSVTRFGYDCEYVYTGMCVLSSYGIAAFGTAEAELILSAYFCDRNVEALL